MKADPPKCECGERIGLCLSERLGRHVCSACLVKEVASRRSVKDKPWEVTIEVTEEVVDSAAGFWWRMECESPGFYIVWDGKYDTEEAAIADARVVLVGLGLVEKAK